MVQRRSLQVGAAAIGLAVAVRLVSSGVLAPLAQRIGKWETASLLLYLETGRVVRYTPEPTAAPTVPETVPTLPALPDRVVFSKEDAALVDFKLEWDYSPDAEALLAQPLDWNLRQEAPTVLILHTHATESYSGEDYAQSSAYRTLDERYNMVSVGEELARLLEEAGIRVIHDKTLHDYPSYTGSYEEARQTAQRYLEEYPNIQLVLDLHRDAAEDGNGNQVATTAQLPIGETAQLMLVLGSDAGGLEHPDWEENLALAAKLQAVLEKQNPGITRPTRLTTQRYNQDLLPGMLLVEVGAAGNTRAQARLAMEPLSQAILALADGA